jgi:phospholipid/cholesterol/gamma-HCH transport system permease protein
MSSQEQPKNEAFSFAHDGDSGLIIRVGGTWRLSGGLPSTAAVERELAAGVRRVGFDTTALQGWDSSVLAFITRIGESCRRRRIAVDFTGLPPGLRRLVELAESVPAQEQALAKAPPAPLLERVGDSAFAYGRSAGEAIEFIGEAAFALARFVTGRARYRKADLFLTIQQCGADALGIVTLISYLVGVILAFMGAVQLQQFGAAIYVADLVGIAMVREMGAMMTGIIMAGRTGAAFAAQLGSMKVRQEIDALNTMGIWPLEFLVMPRLVALVLMMPLLTLYADALGILGGATVGVGMLHLSLGTYMRETMRSVQLYEVFGGLVKSVVYGILIAMAGCLRGMQCGNSASSVGEAATSAVVTGIVLIVAACGIFALLFNILGF